MIKFFVFDFDGVVCDSTNECFVTSQNAWNRWNNRYTFKTSVSEFPENEYSKFCQLRPYVKGAGEYYSVMKLISNKEIDEEINMNLYEKYVDLWKDKFTKFKKIFYFERHRLRESNFEKWISLHVPYKIIVKILAELISQNRVYVATLKDGESVSILLNHYKLEIPESRIIDQSMINNKLEALSKILSIEKIDKKEIIFIDDNINHLKAPKQNGFNVFLSEWSRRPNEYELIAKNENINKLSMNKLSELANSSLL